RIGGSRLNGLAERRTIEREGQVFWAGSSARLAAESTSAWAHCSWTCGTGACGICVVRVVGHGDLRGRKNIVSAQEVRYQLCYRVTGILAFAVFQIWNVK
ncbi:hypothetical protein, partial [Brevibacterium aurantiacum]|uniref:hypothetical protein n=1 Tax=Brevibacterium aurantiacum TaxID=273384 RepID=UPI00196B67F0